MKICQLYKKTITLFVVGLVFFSFLFFNCLLNVKYVIAQNVDPMNGSVTGSSEMSGLDSIKVIDKTVESAVKGNVKATEKGFLEGLKQAISGEKTMEYLAETFTKMASEALGAAAGSAFKTLAYDTATWIGSGGKGQQPLFIKEGWGEYLKNTADNAAGTAIETIGKKWNFNLCQPDIQVKLKIGLGLVQQQRPKAPACTFTKMKTNWEKELKSGDFLNKFQDMFNPTSNDLGIALTLQTNIVEEQKIYETEATKKREEGKAWLNVTDLAGRAEGTPELAQNTTYGLLKTTMESLNKYTGNAFTDAANVFVNQLAITLFRNTLAGLGKDKDTITHPYAGDFGGLADVNSTGANKGIAGAKEQLKKLIEPDFNVRGDYNILMELTLCPNPQKAGPTNCVINNNFSEAVINKLTVINAIKDGYLKQDGVFGFKADGFEPNYNDGDYPYRSMLILRKFRIIPVGWEVAAQYIKDNPNITGTCNLGDMTACFDDSDELNYSSGGCKQGPWCRALVDPNWVLKAPLNYCKREGFGPEKTSEEITGEGIESQLAISRNDKYCADEQSCIKEKSDGSCDIYGYCTQERRIWDFGAGSCDAKYNTCQTFRGRDGNTVSYLENTIYYGSCSVDNVGCLAYCQGYNYLAGNYTCTNTTGSKLFLDKDAEACDDTSEGCREFIRTKAGQGANLFFNSSWEDTDTFGLGTQDCSAMITPAFGKCELVLAAPVPPTVLPLFTSFNTALAGETFTFSLYAKNCGNGSIAIGSDNWATDHDTAIATTSADWQRFSVTHIFKSGAKVLFSLDGVSPGCEIDALKIEKGAAATAYSEYHAASGLVNEKVIPDYLAGDCYVNPGVDYTLKSGYPAVCNSFTRLCNAAEVNCELYTAAKDGISVPAKVKAEDYCPSECSGYNNYLQTEATFDSVRPAFFIPAKAKACTAEAAGCDEFTNLDKAEAGGEAREYYTQLKQCVIPTAPTSDCSEFFTWEGSSETGYQLHVYNLQRDGLEPEVTKNDSLLCNATIYNLLPSDPGYNPDCREFYNNTGAIYYHLNSLTITCSDNCHPFRRTENNIVKDASNFDITQIACEALSQFSDFRDINYSGGQCTFCKNRGVYNSQHNACIYMAIPDEGTTCAANTAGCREYSGSSGSNQRIVTTSDFEGSAQNWIGEGGTTAAISSESLKVGGESLKVNGGTRTISLALGNAVQQGKSYFLSFVAKQVGGAAAFSQIYFDSGTAQAQFAINPNFNLNINSEWKIYNLNLAALDHAVAVGEKLAITANGDFYIDDIRLIEVVDRYFLIKTSWTLPESCLKDIYDNPAGEMHNLGCASYTDRDKKTHYLRQFSQLCQESAVGCELVVDTHNYDSYKIEGWNDGGDNVCGATDKEDCVIAPADNFTYVVYDAKKVCNSEDQGCQKLGTPYDYSGSVLYGDGFFKNDPDDYDKVLCSVEGVGCEEWATSDSNAYFKNPGDQTCEWRQGYQATSSWSWWKKKVKRCDANANAKIESATETKVCLKDTDCGGTFKCIQDDNEYECPTSNLKTFGTDNTGQIAQPVPDAMNNYWTGLCPAEQSGCSEYIDPVSKFSGNILFNPTFADLDRNPTTVGDGWDANEQEVVLESNKLYRIGGYNNPGSVTLSCANNLSRLDENNNLVNAGTAYTLALAAGQYRGALLYTNDNNGCKFKSTNVSVGTVELKKALVDYLLRSAVNKTDCNGIVDFDQGCVLFNERKQNGASTTVSVWDADLTIDDKTGLPPAVGAVADRDTNALLKVTPDRNCDKWLACRSYIKDEKNNNVCFDIGLCDSFDDNGNCSGFVISDSVNQTYPSNVNPDTINNMSGYAKAGGLSPASSELKNNDVYPLGAMKQKGEVAQVANGSFELYGSNGYPNGWTYASTTVSASTWSTNVFTVINNPIQSQIEGVGNAPEGNSFIKFGAAYFAESDYVDVISGASYILTAYINTINLSNGTAKVKIHEFDSAGNYTLTNYDIPDVALASGNGWQFKLGQFTTKATTNRIKIVLYADGVGLEEGNYYFDDVKIKPALAIKDLTPVILTDNYFWYAPQSCRLYSQTDSLSCDYYDDTGARQKGWAGYCLEHDRYPGSTDACLLWYPIDKVKGDSIEEGVGYLSKTPVYYTTEAQTTRFSEYKHVFTCQTMGTEGCKNCSCPPGYKDVEIQCHEESGNDPSTCVCEPDSATAGAAIALDGVVTNYQDVGHDCGGSEGYSVPHPASEYDGWYNYDGNADVTKVYYIDNATTTTNRINPFASYLCDGAVSCSHTAELFRTKLYTTKISLTVTVTGQNKYWAGRVYEGSNYLAPLLSYKYTDDQPPFGSIAPPSPVNNPYEWDGDSTLSDLQPLSYYPESTGYARSGQIYSCVPTNPNDCKYTVDLSSSDFPYAYNDFSVAVSQPGTDIVKRLFAQSYGQWSWVGNVTLGQYIPVTGADWGPPPTICAGAVRPSIYPDDFCSILPKIAADIKVNGVVSGSILLSSNQFVNLTFNSIVDSQQLPLVMYAINWGDNEKTTVTGVEMRDRQNTDNPHSFYHLYSYWDLRAKRNINQLPTGGQNTVYCGAKGTLAENYMGANIGVTCPAASNCCAVKPEIKIKDNWGWCNGGTTIDDCDQWDTFGGTIVVKEK